VKVVSRSAAITSGAIRYFTGMPCKNGHTVERYTLRGDCVTCCAARVAKDRQVIRRQRIVADA
jgi:hypothetical protein